MPAQAGPREPAATRPEGRKAPVRKAGPSPTLLWKARTLSRQARQPLMCQDTLLIRDGYWLLAFDAPSGRPLWRQQTAFDAVPVLGAGTVFVADQKQRILPLDLRGGRKRQTLTVRMCDGAGVVDRGTLFAATPHEQLLAVDIASRVVLWKQPVSGVPVGAPRIQADAMFLQTSPTAGADAGAMAEHCLWSFGTDGRMRWVFTAKEQMLGYRIVDGHGVYVVAQLRPGTSQLTALDTDGSVRWQYDIDGDLAGPPTSARGMLYLTTTAGEVMGWEADTGRQLWHRRVGRSAVTTAQVFDDIVYLALWQPRSFAALDACTGDLVWQRRNMAGSFTSQPFTAGGVVFASHRAGALHGWDMRSRKEVWQADLSWEESVHGQPLVVDGKLYVTSSSGEVSAWALASRPGTSGGARDA
ncbi:PQQ-binding-like beta-propeller repeat protein [Streptomyces paromomycinus]|uniref:PQQ-binding-like beta-propeller repeat protein n=1 Tax=Streptomyces paromomycinus TaxID=92743 RepID=UPI001478D580|nr:PQQ-binding-like beta-propeller repeat protein [Streptomyces paromomycinus]